MADLTPEEIQTMLTEARAALHRVQTGGAVTEVRDRNGDAIVYSATNRSALTAYISWLEGQLGTRPLGPLRPYL